jgi:hypothetical protein
VVSDTQSKLETAIKINQDANIYLSECTQPVSLNISAGRQAYLLCVEGTAALSCAPLSPSESCLSVKDGTSSTELNRHDAAELFGPCELTATPSLSAHLLLVEMAFTGPGRSDL